MVNRTELENKLKSYGYSNIAIQDLLNDIERNHTYNSQNVLDILDTGGSGLLNIWINRNLK
ncbi:hypothetical protein DVV91_10160 [Clostridium botulinum]|uniref:hypothetical protein n=1 Tax=Clostridium botulinum TaxID=1491 RepID=UPI0019678D4C|nr:hypothetical protein [Clostridium botulinum]MBN1074705.1 hypothetical protein [Clostridium botulinum]